MNTPSPYRCMLALLACACFSGPALAEDDQVQVLASLPITFSLGEALLQDTQVTLVRAAPANLPASRQPSYFSTRGASVLEAAAREADATISLRSLWPEDPLYPLARRSNIRIVEIDAARPVDGELPGIALQTDATDLLASQPWLNITNLGRMADVIAADLARLAPADQPQIQRNLATLKQQLLQLNARSESLLAALDNISVDRLNGHADYLLRGLNLDVVETSIPEDGNWSDAALTELSTQLRDYDVALVVLDREPDAALSAAITAGGSKQVVLAESEGNPVSALEGAIGQVIEALADKNDQ